MRSLDQVSLQTRRWILIGYWAAIFLLTHWPDLDRIAQGSRWRFANSDKVVHASFYATWIVLWWWLLKATGRHGQRATAAWLLVGAAAYGIFDELTQGIVGRQPDVMDFACDVFAALVTLVVLMILNRRQRVPRAGLPGSATG